MKLFKKPSADPSNHGDGLAVADRLVAWAWGHPLAGLHVAFRLGISYAQRAPRIRSLLPCRIGNC